MRTIHTEVPEQLYKKAEALVKLDTHQSELMKKFVRNDVEWGLCGND
jgi:hypothetical protein